jgi:hypothetical protein
MKYWLHDVVQFIFFLIAMTALGTVYILYAIYALLNYGYRKIVGEA